MLCVNMGDNDTTPADSGGRHCTNKGGYPVNTGSKVDGVKRPIDGQLTGVDGRHFKDTDKKSDDDDRQRKPNNGHQFVSGQTLSYTMQEVLEENS